MEKFVMAAGCALRISDSGIPTKLEISDNSKPAARHKEYAAATDDTFPANLAVSESTNLAIAEPTDPAALRPVNPVAAECGTDEYITIVLLHGYLESLDVWEDFTRLLSPYMRVIALDLPGHGISEVKGEVHTMEFLAEAVHAVLELLDIKKCVICGHSMGGYVALEFLRKYPQATSGIILFHSVPYADTEEKKENRRREIEIVLGGKKDLLAATTTKSFSPANRKRFAQAIQELSDQAFLTDDDGVLALLRGMGQRRDNNAMLSESIVPQMFIFGRGDEYISAEVAADMITRHPKAQVLWLENSGHMGFIEEPEKSAQAIIKFCEEILKNNVLAKNPSCTLVSSDLH